MRINPGATPLQAQGQARANEFNETLDQIRADQRLMPDYKTKLIAKLWLEYRDAQNADLKKQNDDRAQRRTELERTAFGLPGDADPMSAISYRDAQDRASNLTKRDDALDLLGRAVRSGDDVLAKAIGQRAIEQQWRDVLDAFAENSSPAIVNALTELSDLTTDPVAWRLASEMSFGLMTPSELNGHSENTLRLMAKDADTAPQYRVDAGGRSLVEH